ncbi:CoA-binding domain protein [Candidatus Nitrososphaera gargensis Ga9.2]|uniref:CoA-binding domain protein n=1 Tax=Nitrososphaera gargensis (strain Ga9.2) TaxID=1237085 RepID=K0III5_NITGG|nr:CoA-binding domain protein [Candidatus Nitrososphaera gargensis Ga9.2]
MLYDNTGLLLQRKTILSVQNIVCETLGTLEQMFRDDGFEIVKINAQSDHVPASSQGYDAIVILGGPMAVYDNLPYLQRQQDLIKDAIKNNTPVLGICLGSQLIAQAAGGRVYKGKKKEIGWQDVYVTPASSNDIFRGVTDKTIRVFQWHGDTYDLPANAKMLAYSDLYPQAFRIGSAVGIQFHLEVDRQLIESWIREYSTEISAERIEPESILPAPGNLEQLAARCRLVYNNFSKVLK